MSEGQIHIDSAWSQNLPAEMANRSWKLRACKLDKGDAFILALVPMTEEECKEVAEKNWEGADGQDNANDARSE